MDYLNEVVYVDIGESPGVAVGTIEEYINLGKEETAKLLYQRLNRNRTFLNYLTIQECMEYAQEIREGILSDYITEMANIYPKYYEEKNPKMEFHVIVRQRDEGPVPHVHIHYGKIKDPETLISYICLHKAIYAPQHEDDCKKLNTSEKKELIKFFSTFRKGAFSADSKGNPVPANCWREAADVWISTYSDKLFERDPDGNLVMPDYNEL